RRPRFVPPIAAVDAPARCEILARLRHANQRTMASSVGAGSHGAPPRVRRSTCLRCFAGRNERLQSQQCRLARGGRPVIRCPGCGGRNDMSARSCEWCGRSFVADGRQRSVSWLVPVSGILIGMLAVLLLVLAFASVRSSQSARVVAEPPLSAALSEEI